MTFEARPEVVTPRDQVGAVGTVEGPAAGAGSQLSVVDGQVIVGG